MITLVIAALVGLWVGTATGFFFAAILIANRRPHDYR